MNAPYLHYSFFKKVTEGIPNYIKKEIEYDDDLIFNLSGFNDIGYYYSLKSFKDKYNFSDSLKEKFDEFIVECIIKLSKENDYESLYFLYAMISNNVIDKYLNQYVDSVKGNKLRKEKLYKMIDFSIASKDNFDIKNNNLYKRFKKSFNYYKYMDNLIHEPCIGTLKFLASTEYFKRCYKKKKKFYKSFTNYNIRYPYHKFISLLFRTKKNINDFIMKDNRNIDLILISDKTINKALDEVLEYIEAINEYLFDLKESNLRKLFNIKKEKKL